MEKVAVMGAGVMGYGIGQLLAIAGVEVTLIDLTNEILEKAKDQIKWSLRKLSEKGRIKQDIDSIMRRIRTVTNLDEALKEVNLVIECVPENLGLKKTAFSNLDEKAPECTILASNTSSLSITELAEVTRRPDKVIGMHFFKPPVLMKLVEVVKGDMTSQETVDIITELVKRLGKTPIVVEKDMRGFVVNRVLMAALNKAFWTVYRGEATMEDLDTVMKEVATFPMGLFELADYIGLDTIYEISNNLEDAYGLRVRTCPIIEPILAQGRLGQKTGKGFYDWTNKKPKTKPKVSTNFDLQNIYAVIINEATWLLHENASIPEDIDTAMRLGTSWPWGPFELADKLGIDTVLNRLRMLHAKYSDDRYTPCPLLEKYLNKGRLGQKTGKGFYEYD